MSNKRWGNLGRENHALLSFDKMGLPGFSTPISGCATESVEKGIDQ